MRIFELFQPYELPVEMLSSHKFLSQNVNFDVNKVRILQFIWVPTTPLTDYNESSDMNIVHVEK